MANIKHPTIELPIADISPERHLAEEAFFLLTIMGLQHAFKHDDVVYQVPVTDRIDITSEEEGRRALRLSGVPVFAGSRDLREMGPSSEYGIINIEEGVCEKPPEPTEDGIDVIVDEHFTWRPYVTLIMNTQDHDDVTVVDAKGTELDDDDLIQARFILDHMRQEYRDQHYVELLEEAADEIRSEGTGIVIGPGYQTPFELGILRVVESFKTGENGETVLPKPMLQ